MMPASYNKLETITQKELNEAAQKHARFMKGIRGGARAVLKFKDMSGLDFSGADFSQADFTGSVFVKSSLAGGTFCGTSFFACDLRQANLENANFSRADFRGAYVAGANLTGANLNEADLREGRVLEKDRNGFLKARKRDGVSAAEQDTHKTIFTGARLNRATASVPS